MLPSTLADSSRSCSSWSNKARGPGKKGQLYPTTPSTSPASRSSFASKSRERQRLPQPSLQSKFSLIMEISPLVTSKVIGHSPHDECFI